MYPTVAETVALLQQRDAEARSQRQAHALEVRNAVEQIVRNHVKPPARVWLIGSLASGDFGTNSDVDLVLSGVASAELLAIETEVARAANAEVDLLDLEGLPKSFQERILESGLRLV
jgi:predicted nucleotidyltransferase